MGTFAYEPKLGDGLIEGSFIYGLATFLVGHVFYLFAFTRTRKFSKIRFEMIILIFIYSFLFGNELVSALTENGNSNLIIPINTLLVISLMVWSAIMTGNTWAIGGSILFSLFDSILSWNMFVFHVPQSSLLHVYLLHSSVFNCSLPRSFIKEI
jgi:alkenylglycerophosphocholine hydrolase